MRRPKHGSQSAKRKRRAAQQAAEWRADHPEMTSTMVLGSTGLQLLDDPNAPPPPPAPELDPPTLGAVIPVRLAWRRHGVDVISPALQLFPDTGSRLRVNLIGTQRTSDGRVGLRWYWVSDHIAQDRFNPEAALPLAELGSPAEDDWPPHARAAVRIALRLILTCQEDRSSRDLMLINAWWRVAEGELSLDSFTSSEYELWRLEDKKRRLTPPPGETKKTAHPAAMRSSQGLALGDVQRITERRASIAHPFLVQTTLSKLAEFFPDAHFEVAGFDMASPQLAQALLASWPAEVLELLTPGSRHELEGRARWQLKAGARVDVLSEHLYATLVPDHVKVDSQHGVTIRWQGSEIKPFVSGTYDLSRRLPRGLDRRLVAAFRRLRKGGVDSLVVVEPDGITLNIRPTDFGCEYATRWFGDDHGAALRPIVNALFAQPPGTLFYAGEGWSPRFMGSNNPHYDPTEWSQDSYGITWVNGRLESALDPAETADESEDETA
jgi:hypothetical protein